MDFEMIQWGFYSYLFILTVVAAYLFHNIYTSHQQRETLLQRIKYKNLQMREKLSKSELEGMFKKAGYPLGLNAAKFHFIRYAGCTFWLILNVYSIRQDVDPSAAETFFKVGFPFIVFVFTNPKRILMQYFFRVFRERYEHQKNQELYMLYGMITDEIQEAKTNVPNIPSLLRKFRHYTPLIRPSINRGLRYTNLGAGKVLEIMAEDIGTQEAQEICKILSDLEAANHASLNELLRAREDDYIASLRASRVKRRMRLANVSSVMVFMPLIVYMMDILYVLIQVLNQMTKNITQ